MDEKSSILSRKLPCAAFASGLIGLVRCPRDADRLGCPNQGAQGEPALPLLVQHHLACLPGYER